MSEDPPRDLPLFSESLSGSRSPYPLPAERGKGQPRKGMGGGTAVCFFYLARRPLSVFCNFLSLKVAVWRKVSGATFCFRWFVVVLCFVRSVLLRFWVYVVAFSSRNCFGKILFMSGLLFWGSFSLP